MKKNLEDFPELDKWFDDCGFITHEQWTYLNAEEVAEKITELGCVIESLNKALEIAALELKVKSI